MMETATGVNPLTGGYWVPVRDADPRVVALYRRHYSANLRKNHRSGIAGPSERVILLTTDAKALFVWRIIRPPMERMSQFVRPDPRRARKGLALGEQTLGYSHAETGIMCTVFRNEGPILSSLLIREAVDLAWDRWPGQRLFTYVWDERVKSINPGCCFKKAGWRRCGRNADGRLTILELTP